MAWTATLIDITPKDNRFAMSIRYDDGPSKLVIREYHVIDGSGPAVQRVALSEISSLNVADEAAIDLTPIGPIDLTIPVVLPDPVIAARNAFLKNWHLLLSYDRAVAHSLVSPTDPALLQLEEDVAIAFLPAYLEFM